MGSMSLWLTRNIGPSSSGQNMAAPLRPIRRRFQHTPSPDPQSPQGEWCCYGEKVFNMAEHGPYMALHPLEAPLKERRKDPFNKESLYGSFQESGALMQTLSSKVGLSL